MRLGRVHSLAMGVVLTLAVGLLVNPPSHAVGADRLTKGQIRTLMLTGDEIAHATGVTAVGSRASVECRSIAPIGENFCRYNNVQPDNWFTTTAPYPIGNRLSSFHTSRLARSYIANVGREGVNWSILEWSKDRLVTVAQPSDSLPTLAAFVYQADGALVVSAWCAQNPDTGLQSAVVKCANALAIAQLAKAR